ncbi:MULTISPECIES: sulfatase family protein [unclassified Saccharicrinis]|uniref:sulfatase family protein n=1 Tax=unclassified Saccharicrinis TaxID=2646859 RepID=UPI003D331630
MNKSKLLQIFTAVFIVFWAISCSTDEELRKPNFVIIFTDDQGYQDLGCFGSPTIHSPNIDKMAEEGIKLTSFYVGAPLCTPSRAALMTGSYPTRVNMGERVLLDADSKGLNPNEITIAEVLKSAGYKTGMFGKWHLGDQPEFLPTRQGFDEFFGLPYSYDISPFHGNNKKHNFSPLPLMEGETVIEENPDCDYLTQKFTERAIRFIEENKDEPFFLYIPHPDPHRPIYVSPEFRKDAPDSIKARLEKEDGYIDYAARDKLYKYAINEIDWSVGQVLEALKRAGIDENTLVVFTSDNGPMAGSAKPLRGRKGSFYEGGLREPAVIRWPGKIPAGQVNDEILTAMDLLPTFASLAGAEIPNDRVIDGKDIWPVLVNKESSPHKAFFYHQHGNLKAVRSGEWKLHVSGNTPVALYNLEDDISESKNVLEGNQVIAEDLLSHIKEFKKDIKNNNRPAAYVENPVALSKN